MISQGAGPGVQTAEGAEPGVQTAEGAGPGLPPDNFLRLLAVCV